MSTTSDFVVEVGKGDYSELIIRSGPSRLDAELEVENYLRAAGLEDEGWKVLDSWPYGVDVEGPIR